MSTPTSTYMTFLMHKGASAQSYEKLIDIKDFPNLGGEPELIEVTTLSDKMQRFVKGVQSLEALSFTANYDPTDYQACQELENKQEDYSVWFGGTESAGVVTPTGSLGKFSFTGDLSVFAAGGGVNAARDMTITIAPSTVITPSFS